MSIIQTINKNSWILLVVVGVAMAAFILGDFLGNRSALFQDEQSVGTIAGEAVSYQDYQNTLELQTQAYRLSTQREPDEQALRTLREQAWSKLIQERAFGPEFEKLGLVVTEDELSDMITGDNLHPSLQQAFTNPQTGELDRRALYEFVAREQNIPIIQNFESQLVPERLATKYNNLLTKTRYVTEAEAEEEYYRQTQTASIQYLYVPYTAIPDSTIALNDADLQSYYTENSADFEQTQGRDIKFIKVPVLPSVRDKQELFKEIAKDGRSLQGTTNRSTDSTFIEAASDAPNPIQAYTQKTLPALLKNETLTVGGIYGPYDEGKELVIYKYLQNTTDSSGWSAKASHILFKIDAGEDSLDVKREAQQILRRATTGNFNQLAAQYSEDVSNKDSGGSLGAFSQGDMVPPFNDAIASASKTGVLNRLVKTRFGYHIINVEQLPDFSKMVIGKLSRDVVPSERTIDEAYTRIGRFTRYKTAEALEKAVELDSSLQFVEASNLSPTQSRVAAATETQARDLVLWAYDKDREVNDVSDVFRYDDANVIAVVTSIKEKGDSPFESVKDQVRQIVIKQKKEEFILGKLGEITGNTLAEIQSAYGKEAQIDAEESLTMSSFSLAGVGASPRSIGTAFGLKEGEISAPVRDESAVTIIRLSSKSEPVETADYTVYKSQLEQRNANSSAFKIRQAIVEQYEVEDDRYRYF